MSISLIKQSFILLLIPMTLVHANDIYSQDKIPCASINIIQMSAKKLDTAQKVDDKYIAYTASSAFQSHDLWWFVGVGDITASTTEEAIKVGRNTLKNSSVQINKYAEKVGNEFICNYHPGYIQARGKKFSF